MSFYLSIVFTICNWLPGALVYSMLLGRGKILNWGPVGVALVAAYATFLTLDRTGSYGLAMLIGVTCTVLISLLYAWLALRLDGDAFGVMSIAVHLALLTVVLNWSSLTGGALGVTNIARPAFAQSDWAYTVTAAVLCVLWMCVLYRIDRSWLGRALSALGEHEWHAGGIGVHRVFVLALSFSVFAVGMWLGALMWAPYLHLLYPTDYGFSTFIFLLMIVVAGRPGSFWGVTLSTIALVTLREAMRFLPLSSSVLGPVRLILFGVILFIAVWLRRDTLFPKARSV